MNTQNEEDIFLEKAAKQAFDDLLKNIVFYGISLAIGSVLFAKSGGDGFLFWIGCALILYTGILWTLNLLQVGFVFLTIPINLLNYFRRDRSKKSLLIFDFVATITFLVNLGFVLATYQVTQYYWIQSFPQLKPLGIDFLEIMPL